MVAQLCNYITNHCIVLICVQFSSVQSLSCVRLFATPWTAAHRASLSITNSQSPLKLMSIESVMPSNHLILCRPLLLPPSIFPSIRVFSNESALHMNMLSGCILPCVNVSQLSCYLKTLMPKPISTQHCPGRMTGCHVTSAWLEMLGHRLSSSRLGAERI